MLALTVLAGCKEKEEPNGENSEPEKRPVLRVNYDADDNETERTEWKYDGKNSTCTSYKNGVEYYRQEIRYYGEDYTRTDFNNGEETIKVEVHFNSDGKTVFTYYRGTLVGKTVYKKGQTIDYDYSNGTLESKSIVYLDSNGEMSREEIYNADSELTQYTFRTWEGDNYVDSTFSEGSLTSVEISQWPDEYTRERIYYSNFNNFTNPW